MSSPKNHKNQNKINYLPPDPDLVEQWADEVASDLQLEDLDADDLKSLLQVCIVIQHHASTQGEE